MRNFLVNNMFFRIAVILFCILLLMFFCIVRVVDISVISSLETDTNANCYTVQINDSRGDIYYSGGEKITGADTVYYVVFLPCDEAIAKFSQLTYGAEKEKGLVNLKAKKPAVIKSVNKISGKGIYSYKSSERYLNDLGLEHIIGYIDDEYEGVTGIEKSYNNLLKSSDSTEILFETTASGEFVFGVEPQVKSKKSKNNVYLTIDKDIQSICNNAAKEIKKGAVLVIENSTGKIRGMVSKPGFDVFNLKSAVESKDSPFINRALNAYSVGSVFKPLVAATMLETSKQSYVYNCMGYSDILGIRFYCNNHTGHGKMDLNTAIINSCNTYFYNAGALVNPNAFSEISSILNFGRRIKLAEGIYSASGSITTLNELKKSKANIANFSIGQGNIALSPLVLSNLYSAIANKGFYFSPKLVEGYTEDGKYYKIEKNPKTMVFSDTTADILKTYLINTVNYGTGKNAKPDNSVAGGKTATAQTGRYMGNEEILNAWFCGFFPEETPKYVIVILSEESISGGLDSAPVFKKIAEEITLLSK